MKFPTLGDAGADPRRAAHGWQRIGLDLREARERARTERVGVDVGDDFAEIAQLSGGIDQPRLFLARFAVSNELHKPSRFHARRRLRAEQDLTELPEDIAAKRQSAVELFRDTRI